MDLSTIIEGDAFAPMLEVLGRHNVVGTGWKGVNVNVDDGWRSFAAAEVGEVDAILGYLMALKREAIEVVRPAPEGALLPQRRYGMEFGATRGRRDSRYSC